MDPRTHKFLIFMLFSLATLVLGYTARKRKWADEKASVPLQTGALVGFWAPVAMLSFWGLPLQGDGAKQLLILMLTQPVLMTTAALIMERITRLTRWSRKHRGVLIVGAGLSNQGFTLGSYLCYAVLNPGDLAMRYGIAFVMSMVLLNVLIFYPIAQHYGSDSGGRSVPRLIRDSLLSIHAAPLYLSAVGIVLSLAEVPIPDLIPRWQIMEFLFFAGAGTAYAGIGLRLRLGDSLGVWRMHGALAFLQFGVHPLATFLLLLLMRSIGIVPDELIGQVMMLEAFMPTAINIVILANIFHLDARLASVLWLWNTLIFCALILPFILLWH